MPWPAATLAALLCALSAPCARADGLVDALVSRFAQSDFVFPRATNDVPFLPLAWVEGTAYNESAFTPATGGAATAVAYRQRSADEGAIVPIPIGRRDALVIGEWASVTQFRLTDSSHSLTVTSLSVPVGWARQLDPKWQLAAFVAPLGHTTPGEGWYWETLGGVFARYLRTERIAWVFGAYMDRAPLESFYVPYLGATWSLDRHWSLSLILPWPGVSYAPNPDTLLRLGVSPSGASWSIENANVQSGGEHPRLDLDAWNLGLDAEHRLYGNFWVGLQGGWSGLRGLAVVGGEYQGLSAHLPGTAYLLLTLNFRPPTQLSP
jgi:hypothetical protein